MFYLCIALHRVYRNLSFIRLLLHVYVIEYYALPLINLCMVIALQFEILLIVLDFRDLDS